MLDEIAPIAPGVTPSSSRARCSIGSRTRSSSIGSGISLFTAAPRCAFGWCRPSSRYTTRNGHPPARLSLGFAAYLLFARSDALWKGSDDSARRRPDDVGDEIKAAWKSMGGKCSVSLTRTVCQDVALWDLDFDALPGFTELVSRHLMTLERDCVLWALDACRNAGRSAAERCARGNRRVIDMRSEELTRRLRELRVVPVIVIDEPANAVPLGPAPSPMAACRWRRSPFARAGAAEALRRIAAECPDVLLGAGTVLTPEQASTRRATRARSSSSRPGSTRGVVDYCPEHGFPYFPACARRRKSRRRSRTGLTSVKFFPGGADGRAQAT